MARTPAVVVMPRDEARKAMDEVIDALNEGLTALDRARQIAATIDQRQGYRALGYKSMAACLADELQVTRRRAYQILDEMRMSALLSDAGGAPVAVTSREARALIRAPEVRERVVERVRGGEPAKAVVQEEVRRVRFDDGGAEADYDSGAAVYRCRHCQRTGTIADLRRCIEVVRDEQEGWGA